MTVAVQTTFTASVASGASTVFPYGFKIAHEDDLTVTLDGVEQTTGYSVTNVGDASGGDVVFDVAPTAGVKVVRYLNPILKRETDYQQFGDWMASVVNLDFDRQWLAMQMLAQNTSRSLKLPIDTATNQEITEDAATRANKGFKFDGSGNLILSLFDPDEAQTDSTAAAAAAAASAGAASTSESNAGDSAVAAAASEIAAALSAAEAAASAGSVGFTLTDLQTQSKTAFTTAGSAGTLTVTTSPVYGAIATNQRMRIKFSQASTGADTLNRDATGAKTLKQYDLNGAKVAAVFAANQLADVEYDGVDFVVLASLPPGRTQLGTSSTATQNFTLTAEAANGTMKLARGNVGATTQDILTVDADGRVAHNVAMGCIRLNTANGYGSTNTKIRRFTNVVLNQGADVTYADSATLGGSFTVNKTGVYAISYSDSFASSQHFGLSLNSAQLTTDIQSITAANILKIGVTGGAGSPQTVSDTVYLTAGDVVRAHTTGISASGAAAQFTITRVA
jgi:hypothetical protein